MASRKAAPLNPDDFFKTQRSNESVKEYLSKPEEADIDIAIPNDVTNVGFETTTAPTRKPSRPRALTIAYNPNTKTCLLYTSPSPRD